MAANEQEVIELLLQAKNLSTAEIEEFANHIDGLGSASDKAKKKLDKLQIEQANISSFKELRTEISKIESEVREAEVQYDKLNEALKNTKVKTDEERKAVIAARQERDKARQVLRSQNTAYEKLRRSLSDIGVNTRNTTVKQKELTEQITKQREEVKRLNSEFEKQSAQLDKKVADQEELIRKSKEQVKVEKEAAAAQEKAAAAAQKKAAADKKSAIEQDRVVLAVKKYEAELSKLHAELQKGNITKGQYIKGEEKLRSKLKLTEIQAKATRRALEADNVVTDKKTRRTDLLTTATRRLAQAYTVLLVAQKATQAITDSVGEYGELEAAITKVEKTTNQAREEVIAMTANLEHLSADVTPTATKELLRYAEVAGQLGANTSQDILQLVAAADALNVSTNLAGDEAVTLLTRILTMTNEGIPAIDGLASVVVDMGNNFAVAEDEIVNMTKEIVTGTQAINLGSTAAAAFGTILKESGQQAERSRSSMFRLSQAIKEATVKGGEDLERLSSIIGKTSEEIISDLGEKPEQVLLDFVKGLSRVREEGGLVSDVLADMGITSTETVSVVEVLANQTVRLETALKRAAIAQVDGNRHIEEAAKAFANQESEMARVVNQFTELKAKIGEAYSDETDRLMDNFSEALSENSDAVISLMENLGEFVEGVVEAIGVIEDLGSAFGLTGSIFEDAFLQAKKILNGFTGALRFLASRVLEVRIAFAEWKDELGILSEEGVANLEALRVKLDEVNANLQEDINDINEANRRLAGESSAGYEDLRDAAAKYGSAVSELSAAQQAQLESALKAGAYREEEEETYNQLVAALVRANRQLEVEEKLRKEKATNDAARAEAQKATLEEQNRLHVEASKVIAEIDFSTEKLAEKVENLNKAYQTQNLSLEEYNEQVAILEIAQEIIVKSTTKAAEAQEDLLETYKDSSVEVLNLANSINKQEIALKDLKRQLDDNTKSQAELLAIKTQIANLEKSITQSKRELVILQELENKTLTQLVIEQQKHQVQLDQLERQYRAGTLTYAQYIRKVEELAVKTDFLNKAVGNNTDILNFNNQAKNEAVQSTESLSESLSQNTSELDDNTDSIDKNAAALLKQKKATTEVYAAQTGDSAAAAALIAEIGLEEYNRLLRAAHQGTAADGHRQRTLIRQGEEALARLEAETKDNESDGGGNKTSNSNNTNTNSDIGLGNFQGSGTVRIELALPNGSVTNINVADQSDADSLINALTSLGEINISGVE